MKNNPLAVTAGPPRLGRPVLRTASGKLSVTLVASRRNLLDEREEKVQLQKSAVRATPEQVEEHYHPMQTGVSPRPASRYVPPPPQLTPEQAEQLLTVQQNPKHTRKKGSPMRQGQLPLEIVSKGRFEKSEPTIHHGEDLDVPTYIRRGVALN